MYPDFSDQKETRTTTSDQKEVYRSSSYDQKEIYRSPAVNDGHAPIIVLDSVVTQTIPSQCCAFQELEKARLTQQHGASNPKTDKDRFIDWILDCRNKDETLTDDVKGSCPFAKCHFICHPTEKLKFLKHVTTCTSIRDGIYNCPYCKLRVEKFMVKQPKEKWCRVHEMISAFRLLCRGLSHASHLSYMSRVDDSSITITHSDSSSEHRYSDAYAHLKRLDKSRSTFSPPDGPSSARVAENLAANHAFEMDDCKRNTFERAPDLRRLGELASTSATYLAQPDPNIDYTESHIESKSLMDKGRYDEKGRTTSTESSASPTSSTSPDIYISDEQFKETIIRQTVTRFMENLSSSEEPTAGVGTVLVWPMNQEKKKQKKTRSLSSRSAAKKAVDRYRATPQVPDLPHLNTNVEQLRPVGASISPVSSPTGSVEKLRSSCDRPEVLDQEPAQLFHECRSMSYNVTLYMYAVLYDLGETEGMEACSKILSQSTSYADVFWSGWSTIESILRDEIPSDITKLLALANLAITCGLLVWERNVRHQFQEIYEDLRLRGLALQNPQQRQEYLQIIARMFGKDPNEALSPQHVAEQAQDQSSFSSSRKASKIYSSFNRRELKTLSRDGIVTRLSIQYLTTLEFLQKKHHDPYLHINFDYISNFEIPVISPRHTFALNEVIIKPLLAMDMFRALEPSIRLVAERLRQNPQMSVRVLELTLICFPRYRAQDHDLHLKFRHRVAELCYEVSIMLDYPLTEPRVYLLQDISGMRLLQQDIDRKDRPGPREDFSMGLEDSLSPDDSAGFGVPGLFTPEQHDDYRLSQSFEPILQQSIHSHEQREVPSQYAAGTVEKSPVDLTPWLPDGFMVQTPIKTTNASNIPGSMNPPEVPFGRTLSSSQSSRGETIFSVASATLPTPSTMPSFSGMLDFTSLHTQSQMVTKKKVTFVDDLSPKEALQDFYRTFKADLGPEELFNLSQEYEKNAHLLDEDLPLEGIDNYLATEDVEQHWEHNEVISENDPLPAGYIPPAGAMMDIDTNVVPGNADNPFPTEPSEAASLTCELCKQPFSGQIRYQRGNLSRHIREVHHAEVQPLWPCDVCEKKVYKRKSNLLQHIRKKHPEIEAEEE